MSSFETPMMQQYLALKNQYPDCILLFRLGDFYEMFLDDAQVGSKILNITLTTRDRGKDGRVPMCGVPYHALDNYLPKLVSAGHKVAICEQVTEPGVGNLVEREVVRIVTPGTILSEAIPRKTNNYVMSIYYKDKSLGLAFADLATGEFFTNQFITDDVKLTLAEESKKFAPSECILPEHHYNDPEFLKIVKESTSANIFPFFAWHEFAGDYTVSENFLKSHTKTASLETFKLAGLMEAIFSSAGLLGYLHHTQKGKISHIKKITRYESDDFVSLDSATVGNLELFKTIRGDETEGTLFFVLDQTKTSMGARRLKQWISRPLRSLQKIEERLDAVEYLLDDWSISEELGNLLSQIYDIERLLARLSTGIGNARDLYNLRLSFEHAFLLADKLKSAKPVFFAQIKNLDNKKTRKIAEFIKQYIKDEPPIDTKAGGLINRGVSDKLDNLRDLLEGGSSWLADYEAKQREISGINSLKVNFNKVYGYYIEISKSNLASVPENYLRKQTLVNAERFITPELKEKEEAYLTADEAINKLEYEIFCEVVDEIVKDSQILQDAAQAIAQLDCIFAFAAVARKNRYSRPKLNQKGIINIKEGRHPVVERADVINSFVPNDTYLDSKDNQLHLITGPNMAGKSVYIRQVALITLLAHAGSFVPASSADISIVDKIFVRSGASDSIHRGLSTFMVEMVETAFILNNATKDSLIVMDEIGRGTSTYDGISIAYAIAEYLVTAFGKEGPKTLFSTHYHELQELEKDFPKIKNYQVLVRHENGDPVFLHKVVSGGASHSFGISVARLAGLPQKVLESAQKRLK